MSTVDRSAVTGDTVADAHLGRLIDDQPYDVDSLFVVSPQHRLTLGELRRHVETLADTLAAAGVTTGTPVGTLVEEGSASLVAMFATWRVGGVYVPINGRYTEREVDDFIAETPVALVIGGPRSAATRRDTHGAVVVDPADWSSRIVTPADRSMSGYDSDVALVLRTSGTTGRPKAVLLRHSGTIGALDSSLRKLRRTGRRPAAEPRARLNMIPTSLSLWAGIYNTTFSFRAGFGVVLLDKFTVEGFAAAVREFGIRSTVLAPAMITMLVDSDDVHDLSPLTYVRSITAPLAPETARAFYEKFGAFVLNSYGQTELGGEVVGWTTADVREFGVEKLGAAGRPYDDVDLQVRAADGRVLPAGELGEIHVMSPFRMRGYAAQEDAADDRFVDGYLRTGDLGYVDDDGFVWIKGRVSDMINRGGLKVHPDEVEEALRRHPGVRDAVVAGVPDRRLGEVPHAWVISDDDAVLDELAAWCRTFVAPYKVPVGFTRVDAFPRNDIGKVLRRQLVSTLTST